MNPASPPPAYYTDDLLGDPVYSRLKEYLIESTGLAYYIDKDADLARRIRRRLSGFGFEDCATYLDLLKDPRRGPPEMDALIAEVTIGETYFFRHQEHFDALRELVLPDLVARNAPNRRLRIWCAGCSDGAEPYTLSILLRRELANLVAGWDISILGTDINRQCLANAREGRFEEWSLRATSEERRRACFQQKGKHWTIAPEFKAGVSFQFHNLVEKLDDSSSFDLIVCRNVMIYFGSELMQRIVRQFHERLAPGAWLLVGPSEPNMTCFTSFQVVNAPGVTLYQKSREAGTTGETADPVTPVPPRNQQVTSPSGQAFSLPELLTAVPFEPPPVVRTKQSGAGALSPQTLADLRQCANRGDWENAARCGKALLESDNLNALVHFHYALVLEQMGNPEESERSLRRAIYLDRQAVLTHYHLGRLLRSRAEWRQAARCFENALKLLEPMPGDAVLTDADGMTVAELRKLAQIQVESLKEQV